MAALLAVGGAVVAASRLGDARGRVVDRIDPALVSALGLTSAMLNQETGVRGYVLGGRPDFLEPYAAGARTSARALAELDRIAVQEPRLRADLSQVASQIREWRNAYARPTIAQVSRDGPGVEEASAAEGKMRFDAVRAGVADLQRNLRNAREEARADLADAATALSWTLAFAAVVLLVGLVVLATVARGVIARPIGRLADQVRDVASGSIDREIESSGPRDVAGLGDDVESMRERILDELRSVQAAEDELRRKAAELERSNAELEQFAYVASHDLQEPLRKVTSFCQMIERRYGGQLDERGEQYIHFAVDGAKRMQVLINDLLAFSRVGRMERPHEDIDADELVTQATTNLAAAIEDSGAEVEIEGDLPVVRGERSLLGLVFQNLIGNGIKFRGEETPCVRVAAEREDGFWAFTIADNGIGIDAQYAERIFIIFQRLHAKEEYAGTGIGLAMCRKVVEHHGGRIWLDESNNGRGATFHFTLPAVESATAQEEEPVIERTTT